MTAVPKRTMKTKPIQSDERFKIWENGHLQVVLDRKRVVPNDPGADTPAMVYYKGSKYEASSTYWCAIGESELEITAPRKYEYGRHKLTQNQCEWLDSLDPELTEFLYNTNPICQGV
jgi:hypothetical protein